MEQKPRKLQEYAKAYKEAKENEIMNINSTGTKAYVDNTSITAAPTRPSIYMGDVKIP